MIRPWDVSLHRQLLLWLLLPQLVLWAAAAWFAYTIAVGHTNRAIDAALSQSTRSLARQIKPIDNGLFIDFPRAAQDIIETDPSDRALYMVSSPPGQFILGNRLLPPPPPDRTPRVGQTTFYDGRMLMAGDGGQEQPVRVAALMLAYGNPDAAEPQTMLVQIARSSAPRAELAREILRDTALPLSGLIVAMTLIVWAGIRAGLAPLGRLRTQVENRAPGHLEPLSLDTAPVEVRALARALNTLLGAVQHSVVTQKRFLNDAAHQLRTPLAGLKSQAELAQQALAELPPEVPRAAIEPLRQRLERVQASASRSAHLVSQLLTLARAEPEALGAQPRERVDVAQLARELTADAIKRARAAGIDLGYDDGGAEDGPAKAPAEVDGIALLLREALSNLVDNALAYAGRGAEVTVRCRTERDEVVLEVEDDGPGLPEDELERVFERFVRGTNDGRGCGLGLPIVREVVQRHGGRVSLQRRTPRGLVAQIRLPRAG